MRPVTQRTFGMPRGECVRAAYASLLGLSIDEVPRFDPEALAGRDLHAAERAWLRSRGLDLVGFQATRAGVVPLGQGEPTEADQIDPSVLACVPPVEHLISGFSPRGFGHRCVGRGGRILWDPHPSRAGLKTVFAVGLVVPRC